jgi:TetR/AcrR family transcriptional regulator, repressor for neighboring sulfatase
MKSTANSRKRRPRAAAPTPGARGAEATRAALVRAFVRLCAERGVASVSVRQVAAAAGVNHGLVHRHFGSKEGLVRAALLDVTARVYDEARPGLSARSMAAFAEDPLLPRLVARLCLDGPEDLLAGAAPPPARLAALVAPMARLLEHLRLPVDAHVANALGTCALLGWHVFRPLLERGYGLPADADDEVARLLAAIDALLAAT